MLITDSTPAQVIMHRSDWQMVLKRVYPGCQHKGSGWVGWHEWISVHPLIISIGPDLLEITLCWYNWQRLLDLLNELIENEDEQQAKLGTIVTTIQQANQKKEARPDRRETIRTAALPQEIKTRVVSPPLEARQQTLSQLVVGEEIQLEREHDHLHTPHAIKVIARFHPIGYIEPDLAIQLAPVFDVYQFPVTAVVVALPSELNGDVQIIFTVPHKKKL